MDAQKTSSGMEPGTTLAKTYERMLPDRTNYLDDARRFSRLTLPSIYPPEGSKGQHVELHSGRQSVGAEGVDHLASTYALTLFPPNTPSFRLAMPELLAHDLATQGGDEGKTIKAEIEAAFGLFEKEVTTLLEGSNIRAKLPRLFAHLLIAGNVLFHFDRKTLTFRVFGLDQFVVKRDHTGKPIKIILKEEIHWQALPEAIREAAIAAGQIKPEDAASDKKGKVSVYTGIINENGRIKVHQEVFEMTVEGSQADYPESLSPWRAPRFILVDGEDYGRGFGERVIGDLTTLESATEATVDGSLAMAKMLIMVNPNGLTEAEDVANSKNGAVIEGRAEDVTAFQVNKFGDFRVALELIDKTERRLHRAFLRNLSVQRSGERVTAREIELLALELQSSHGGVYSVLAEELQRPIIALLLHQVEQANQTSLPKDLIKPVVIAGLEGLRRSREQLNLDTFVGTLQNSIGPDATAQAIHVPELAARVALNTGVDPKGLIKTPQEFAETQQQQAMQEAAQTLGPAAIQAGTDIALSDAASEG